MTRPTDDDRPLLTCAACRTSMESEEAAPAPDGIPDALRYHKSLLTCWQRIEGRPATASSWRPIARTA